MDRAALLKEFGFEEEVKELSTTTTPGEQWGPTGFPKPEKSYRLTYEVYDMSLEKHYYWMVEQLRQTFMIVEKVEDSFSSAENSAFFGVTQQRLGAQQDKVSQFLATTGKMIKELFQMVRELRIIDERLGYYVESAQQSEKPLSKRGKTAEITLKGMFVDLVQGGGKSAASVYGMARELEFVTLPDLFFDAPPFATTQELENHIKSLEADFNNNVLRVLGRHLRQFMQWKKNTALEHKNRKRFMLNYLEQHFQIINMYLAWVKPYLKHIENLSMREKKTDMPEIVSAFETSMLDVELLARKREAVGKYGVNGCILVTMNYRTRPELKVVQEGYQRGPVHIGRFEYNYRIYGWSDEQVEQYKKMKQKESLLLLGDVSQTVQKAMHALGADLEKYLEEARSMREDFKEKKKEESKPDKRSLSEVLFGDFYRPKSRKATRPKVRKSQARKDKADKHAAKALQKKVLKYATVQCYPAYHNFKKTMDMLTW